MRDGITPREDPRKVVEEQMRGGRTGNPSTQKWSWTKTAKTARGE